MPLFFPSQEVHYLTREGDRVDLICQDYYGACDLVTELVYARNAILTTQPPVLPTGLIIALPAITESLYSVDSLTGMSPAFVAQLNSMSSNELAAYLTTHPLPAQTSKVAVLTGTTPAPADTIQENSVQLWDYTNRARTLYTSPSAPDRSAVELAALTAYRAIRDAVSGGGTSNPNIPANPDLSNPLVLEDFEWFAVYYKDTTGRWTIGRIHKRNVRFNTDGYGHVISGTTPWPDELLSGLI